MSSLISLVHRRSPATLLHAAPACPASWPCARAAASVVPGLRAYSQSLALCAPKGKARAGAGNSAAATAAAAPPANEGAYVDTDAGDIEAEVERSGGDLKAATAKHVDWAKRELAKLRGVTASAGMLDHVPVEVYGERQPLTAVAQVSLRNANTIVVSPFDSALASAIADAIRDAGLGLNPSAEGGVVRVPVPKPSKESRDATLRLVAKIAEAARTRIRRVRQAAMDRLKKVEGVSPDETFREMKDVQALIAAATEDIGKLADKKRRELEQQQ